MTKSFPLILTAVAAVSLGVAGCAGKPKTVPGASLGRQMEDAPGTGPASPPSGPSQRSRTLQEDLAATASDRVFFALDSSVIDAEADAILRRQAVWLRSHPDVRARIAGNADERGTREYNLALGARRAAAVREVFIARGVSPHRLETLSYGKEQPMDPAPNEDAWAKNRNAQTVVIEFGSP